MGFAAGAPRAVSVAFGQSIPKINHQKSKINIHQSFRDPYLPSPIFYLRTPISANLTFRVEGIMIGSDMMNLFRFSILCWALLSVGVRGDNTIEDRLREAERELNMAEATSRRVQARLSELQADSEATTEQILAMESYAHELEEIVKIRRKTLKEVREIAGKPVDPPDLAVLEGMEAFEEALGEVPDGADPESEQERLDREFLASLEAFDTMIGDHLVQLKREVDSRMAKGEQAAGERQSAADDAEALLRSMGVDPGGEEGEAVASAEANGREAEGEEADIASTDPAETAETAEVTDAAATGGGTAGGRGSSRPPRSDEDIVARQLREAAEKETDPVLREKLWKEYEAYLDGR
jgi:peptidoglycan hydrolase CwlO-like protein